MKEAYVSFELAKLLKEKGFNEPCIKHWDCDDYSLYGANDIPISNSELRDNEYNGVSAPTHQIVCAWLREKSIECVVIPIWNTISKQYRSYVLSDLGDKYKDNYDSYSDNISYEDAVEAALKYSLENLL